MSPVFHKKTLAIFSLTCCEGCEFEVLSPYDDINELLKFYDIKNFRLGQEINLPGPFDISVIEGNPEGAKQEEFAKEIRKQSSAVVALGACAHMGGIQSERNRLPKKLIDKEKTKTLDEVIKVDYILPGCPVNHNEVVRCLLDAYWGKIFTLPDTAVCFECRLNENQCHLKNNRPCLGPVTRSGCNSVCVNGGEACLGCRGPIEQANFKKLRQELNRTGYDDQEIDNLLTIYGDYEKEHKKLIRK